ncbi:MAG: hypothetical protein AB1586_17780 [Pseudomonadota bacterium]
MFDVHPAVIFLSDLRSDPIQTNWFEEDSPKGLAGRCLLDAVEYLHATPKIPGRFWHVVNAHAIRLVHRCLTDKALDRLHVLDRMKGHIEQTCQQLLMSRQASVPHYGDDFWDWAAVVNALAEVQSVSTSAGRVSKAELQSYHQNVKVRTAKGSDGLSIGDPDREWFGPATAALAYRVLSKHEEDGEDILDLLARLKAQALQTIVDGKYLGHEISPLHTLWHYGQVVALFAKDETRFQADRLADFSPLKAPMEQSERVYMLARILQGASAVRNETAVGAALDRLYKCQNLRRPLGQGLVGETVKGSLNVLDALWPNLSSGDKAAIGVMLDALLAQYAKANTIGFPVAISHEAEAVEAELLAGGARVTHRNEDTTLIEHDELQFRAVICLGKAIGGATGATLSLIKEHRARWIMMSGIAGSLGMSVPNEGGVQFRGPDKGDVVIAAASAPFQIRRKLREVIENAKVPFNGSTWLMIPSDPRLFRLAHEVADAMAKDKTEDLGAFYEGLIVTGTGVMDSMEEKKRLLAEFPGGLAVEEEGYMMGIVCLGHGVPYLNIRGISDRAEGDKALQGRDEKREVREQKAAARMAARLAVKAAMLLSQRW